MRAGAVLAAAAVLAGLAAGTATTGAAAATACEPPKVTVVDLTQYEGSGGGTKTVAFTVIMAQPTPGCPASGSVRYRTVDATAVAGQDYLAVTGTLSWTSPSVRAVGVQVVRDAQHELDEQFDLQLYGPRGVSIVDETAIGAILDDDGPAPDPGLTVAVANGGICWWPSDVCEIPLELNATPRAPVAVRLSTVDGTAVAGEDYLPIEGATVTFPTGVSRVQVPVELVGEPADGSAFYAVISRPTAGTVTESRGKITIQRRS